jgi:hypothetical protein
MAKANSATTFSNDGDHVHGPEPFKTSSCMLNLSKTSSCMLNFQPFKTSGVYALPSAADAQQPGMAGASVQMSLEEIMHLRLDHIVNYTKLKLLSKSGV